MAMKVLGDFCADLGKREEGDRSSRYQKLGIALIDETGKIAVKIDVLPLPGSTWKGWCNIFNREDKSTTAPPKGSRLAQLEEDDVPF